MINKATLSYGLLAGLLPAWMFLPSSVRAQAAAAKSVEKEFVRLEIAPHNVILDGAQARQQMLVNGYRRDGSVADVTEQARFTSSNSSIARVEGQGLALPTGEGRAT